MEDPPGVDLGWVFECKWELIQGNVSQNMRREGGNTGQASLSAVHQHGQRTVTWLRNSRKQHRRQAWHYLPEERRSRCFHTPTPLSDCWTRGEGQGRKASATLPSCLLCTSLWGWWGALAARESTEGMRSRYRCWKSGPVCTEIAKASQKCSSCCRKECQKGGKCQHL